MNKKTDFQIGMDENKTYYRLIKKQEAPKQLSGYAVKKKKYQEICDSIWRGG